MNIIKEKNTIIFQLEEKNTIDNCIDEIKNTLSIFNQNIIIDSTLCKFSIEEITKLIPISTEFKETHNRSFVLIINNFSYEDLPEDLTLSPTLQEAFDIIELEDIERNLGI